MVLVQRNRKQRGTDCHTVHFYTIKNKAEPVRGPQLLLAKMACLCHHGPLEAVARDAELLCGPSNDYLVGGQVRDRRARVNRLVNALRATLADGAALGVVLVHAHDGSWGLALRSTDVVAGQHNRVVLEQINMTCKQIQQSSIVDQQEAIIKINSQTANANLPSRVLVTPRARPA